MCLAYTTEGDEVGISILANALYQIEAPNQTFNIVDGISKVEIQFCKVISSPADKL